MTSLYRFQSALRQITSLNQRTFELLAVVCAVAFGAALRFYQLGDESYWVDEVIMLGVTSSLDTVRASLPTRPPVYVLLTYGWVQLFGTTETATRALPALLSTLALVMVYLLGKRSFSHQVGLVALILMSVSYSVVYQAQNIRYYSLLILLAVVSCYLLLLWLEDARRYAMVLYGIGITLLYHTHTFGLFIVIGFNLYFLVQIKTYRRLLLPWVVLHLIWVGAIGRHLFSLQRNVGDGLDWIPPAEPNDLLTNLTFFLFERGIWPSITSLAIAGALLAVVMPLYISRLGWPGWLRAGREALDELISRLLRDRGVLLMACWLVGGIGIPILISLVYKPIYFPRYTLGAAPAFFLLLALGIVTCRAFFPAALAVSMIFVLNLPLLYQYYERDVKEQWREAAQYVAAAGQPDDVILFVQTERWEPIPAAFAWYYHGPAPSCEIAKTPLGDDAQAAASLAACLNDRRRAWLVVKETPEGFPVYFEREFLPRNEQLVRVVAAQEFTEVRVILLEQARD